MDEHASYDDEEEDRCNADDKGCSEFSLWIFLDERNNENRKPKHPHMATARNVHWSEEPYAAAADFRNAGSSRFSSSGLFCASLIWCSESAVRCRK